MELRIVVNHGTEARPLSVLLDPEDPVEVLLAVIGPRIGEPPERLDLVAERSGLTLERGTPVAGYQLRTGDRLRAVVRGSKPSGSGVWVLTAIKGRASGVEIPLGAGTTVLGRIIEPGGIPLDDPRVSRRHARVDIQDRHATIADAGSSNGTTVNGVVVGSTPVPLRNGDHIEIGDSVLEASVRAPQILGAHIRYEDGSLCFNRPPRVGGQPPTRVFDVPRAPATPPPRRVSMLTILLPALLSVAMFATAQNAMFLLMALATPLMAVLSTLDDRRSGRREFRDQADRFRARVAAIAAEAEVAQATAASWWMASAPPPSEVSRRIRDIDTTLWRRRPRDGDFLHIRMAAGSQPSGISFRLEDEGDPDLTRQARTRLSTYATCPEGPITIDLRQAAVLGVAGASDAALSVARWMAIQIAAHHSPREVAMSVLAPAAGAEWEWAKWLPHASVLDKGRLSIAADDADARTLFDGLRALIDRRTRDDRAVIESRRPLHLPHAVVFIQPPIRLPAGEVSGLLDAATSAGISIAWLAEDPAALPGACRAVLDVDAGTLTRPDGSTVSGLTLEGLTADTALDDALGLACLRDASSEESSDIPLRIDLMAILDPPADSPEAVVARWSQPHPGLSAPLGISATGIHELDLASEGPHGLLAGTTGAGKSELLQTLIASLAVTHPPNRVNFVLVDYKGGAAFKDCVHLPHTVGFITDLDGGLALRAVQSLDAELKRREKALADAGAKDLADLRRRAPQSALPSLVIVIDEFAALATEVPAFLDGIIDIARRGRSLGVHLLLATQKPGGVITADIQANTNLRVALRVTSPDESIDVIGVPDAALLTRRQVGRAYLKTGPSEIVEAQIAYVGGPPPSADAPRSVARTFRIKPTARKAPDSGTTTESPSQLQVLVHTAIQAAAQADIAAQRRPWLPPLPKAIPFEGLAPSGGLACPSVVIGVADEPSRQQQPPLVLDLERAGVVGIYGTTGSGKTTALRTTAAALAANYSADEAHLYGIDFAGTGLSAISLLPHCGDIVGVGDIDRVRRLVAMLDAQAATRRVAFGAHGSGSLEEYRASGGRDVPAIVVLIDGFTALWSALERPHLYPVADALGRLITEGRGAGIHFVITADRRGGLPASLSRSIPMHVMMRMADADEYLTLPGGVPAGFEKAAPGRCWLESGQAQIATLGSAAGATGTAQNRALADLAATRDAPRVPPERIRLLPDQVALSELPPVAPGSVCLGIDEDKLSPFTVDLVESPLFLIAGPPRSGRTTALRVIAEGLTGSGGVGTAILLGPRTNSLFDAPWWTITGRGMAEIEVATQQVLDMLKNRDPSTEPFFIAIDDADEIEDPAGLDLLMRAAREAGAPVVVTTSTHGALQGFEPWIQMMRHTRVGLLLQPNEDDGEILHARLPQRPDAKYPPGRGYVVRGQEVTLVQVATAPPHPPNPLRALPTWTAPEPLVTEVPWSEPWTDRPTPPAVGAPSGGLQTILFTDIEGSTTLTSRLGDTAARAVLRRHEEIVREALRRHGGVEIKTMGDGFMASFGSAVAAVECAITMQRSLAEYNATAAEPIRVRVGMNAGEPIAEGGDLFGTAVITASRIGAQAGSCEIHVSDVVRQLVAGKGFRFTDRGTVTLRGLDEPVRIHVVDWQGSVDSGTNGPTPDGSGGDDGG